MKDIIVVGGGISGSIAAVAAARLGAKVLVIEQYGFLGGMITAAGVGPMMTFHAGDKQVVQGITGELLERLIAKGRSPGHIMDTTGYASTITPFEAEGMKHELELMLLDAGGEILYHSMLAGVHTTGTRIESVRVCNKAGLSSIPGKVFIDASGDADLSAWAGVPCTKGRESDGANQPLTTNVRLGNVNIERLKTHMKQDPDDFKGWYIPVNEVVDAAPRLAVNGFFKKVKAAEDTGEISWFLHQLLLFETNSPGEVIANTTHIWNIDPTDPVSLSRAEIEGRKQVREIAAFLIGKIPGFENAFVEYSGPRVGVRSSRQIQGRYRLSKDELLACRRFDDVIAHGGYPIDVHSPEPIYNEELLAEAFALKKGDYYSIPYRCLVNDSIENLVTVGRCISADFKAQGAVRVSPIAGAVGHGGGVGAALAWKHEIPARDVSTAELQSILRDQGAYLETTATA
jgi:hypothetical protein